MHKLLSKKRLLILLTAIIVLACIVSVQIYKKEKDQAKDNLLPKGPTLEEVASVDVESLIHVRSRSSLESIRSQLSHAIFKDYALSSIAPTRTKESSPAKLDQKTKIQIPAKGYRVLEHVYSMPNGVTSYTWQILQPSPSSTWFIWHQGHSGKLTRGESIVQTALEKGCNVVLLNMPCRGGNLCPEVYDHPQFGPLWTNPKSHEGLAFHAGPSFSPFYYFIAPVIGEINAIKRAQPNAVVIMSGLSGGGWTTTLCAALDERITWSMPIAGSYPLFMRHQERKNSCIGDYEQGDLTIYTIANYLDMYVMGSAGTTDAHRESVQVLNRFDSCCFGGTAAHIYESPVTNALREVCGESGSYRLVIDETLHKHGVPQIAQQLLIDHLEKIDD